MNNTVNQSFTPFTPNPSQPMQPVNYPINNMDPQQPSHLQQQWQPNPSLNPLNNPSSVHLFPPSNTTQPPQFHGPVIVPTMQQPTIFHPQPPPSQPPSIITPNPPSNKVSMAKDPMSDIPVPGVLNNDDLQVPSFHDDTQMFHYTTTRLQRSINDCSHTSDKHLLEEIEKKMSIFSEQWTSQRISYPVKSIMARLATAIHRRRCDVAEELQMSLVLDHITESSKWSVAVKRLIQEVLKVDNHPISPSVSCEEALSGGAEGVGGSGVGVGGSVGGVGVGGSVGGVGASLGANASGGVGASNGVGSSGGGGVVGNSSGILNVGSSDVVESFTTAATKDDGSNTSINSNILIGNVANNTTNNFKSSNISPTNHPVPSPANNSFTNGGNVSWQGNNLLSNNNVLLQQNVNNLTNQSPLLTSFHTPSNATNITASPGIQASFNQPASATLFTPTALNTPPTTLFTHTTSSTHMTPITPPTHMTPITPPTHITPIPPPTHISPIAPPTHITPQTTIPPPQVRPTQSNTEQNLIPSYNENTSLNKSHSTGDFFNQQQTSSNVVPAALTSQDAASFFDNIAPNVSPDFIRTSSFPFLAFNKTPSTDLNKTVDPSVDKVNDSVDKVDDSVDKQQQNDSVDKVDPSVDKSVAQSSDVLDTIDSTQNNVEVVEGDKIENVAQENNVAPIPQQEESLNVSQEEAKDLKVDSSTHPSHDFGAVLPLQLSQSDKLTEIIQTTQDIVLNDDDDDDDDDYGCKVTNTADDNDDDCDKDDFKTVDL